MTDHPPSYPPTVAERMQRRIEAAIDAARLRDYRGDLQDRHEERRTR